MKIALVLSGGGAKGIYQARLWQRISREFEIDPCVISGVSVGALNAAMIAQGRILEMNEVWNSIEAKDVYKKRSLFGIALRYGLHKIGVAKAPMGAYDNSPLLKLIQAHTNINQVKIPLKIGRVNLADGSYRSALDPARFHEQILASTAIPVIWPPVEYGGSQWVDGGVRNVTPLADALPYNPDLVIIIPTSPYRGPVSRSASREKDLVEVGKRSLEILMDEIFFNDIDRFLDCNALVRHIEGLGGKPVNRNGKKLKSFKYLILSPEQSLGRALDFSRETLNSRKKTADEHFQTFRPLIENKINAI